MRKTNNMCVLEWCSEKGASADSCHKRTGEVQREETPNSPTRGCGTKQQGGLFKSAEQWNTKKCWGTVLDHRRLRRCGNEMQCEFPNWILIQKKGNRYWDDLFHSQQLVSCPLWGPEPKSGIDVLYQCYFPDVIFPAWNIWIFVICRRWNVGFLFRWITSEPKGRHMHHSKTGGLGFERRRWLPLVHSE